MNRHAAETETGAVDQRSIDVVDVLLERIDDCSLRVGLHRDELNVDFSGKFSEPCIDLIQRCRPVDLWFATAEQIQIRSVNH
jgi:hypothetical protein